VSPLPQRRIGPFTVSAIGLGCMNLSHGYGAPPSEEDAARLLNHALDLGVTLLDTAALYGGGRNETLIGRAVIGRRAEFTLASKGVLDQVEGRRVLDGRPEAIAASLDRSLARLGTDRIDLHYLHRLDPAVPIEESVGALVRAKEAGKILAIGLSEMSAETLRRAQAVHPIAAVQTEYSPVVRNADVAVLDACRTTNTGFVAFSPVARGLLAGGVAHDRYAAGDLRAGMPRFTGERLRANLQVVGRFDALARQAGLSPAQLSLGWVLARGTHIVPIPGTRSIAHLEENVAAATRPVDPGIVAAVDALFADRPLVGARYPAAMQAQIDTERLPGEEMA